MAAAASRTIEYWDAFAHENKEIPNTQKAKRELEASVPGLAPVLYENPAKSTYTFTVPFKFSILNASGKLQTLHIAPEYIVKHEDDDAYYFEEEILKNGIMSEASTLGYITNQRLRYVHIADAEDLPKTGDIEIGDPKQTYKIEINLKILIKNPVHHTLGLNIPAFPTQTIGDIRIACQPFFQTEDITLIQLSKDGLTRTIEDNNDKQISVLNDNEEIMCTNYIHGDVFWNSYTALITKFDGLEPSARTDKSEFFNVLGNLIWSEPIELKINDVGFPDFTTETIIPSDLTIVENDDADEEGDVNVKFITSGPHFDEDCMRQLGYCADFVDDNSLQLELNSKKDASGVFTIFNRTVFAGISLSIKNAATDDASLYSVVVCERQVLPSSCLVALTKAFGVGDLKVFTDVHCTTEIGFPSKIPLAGFNGNYFFKFQAADTFEDEAAASEDEAEGFEDEAEGSEDEAEGFADVIRRNALPKFYNLFKNRMQEQDTEFDVQMAGMLDLAQRSGFPNATWTETESGLPVFTVEMSFVFLDAAMSKKKKFDIKPTVASDGKINFSNLLFKINYRLIRQGESECFKVKVFQNGERIKSDIPLTNTTGFFDLEFYLKINGEWFQVLLSSGKLQLPVSPITLTRSDGTRKSVTEGIYFKHLENVVSITQP